MKKLACVVAVLALCALPTLADDLQLRIVGVGNVDEYDASSGGTFTYYIQGQIPGTPTSDGLALWGVNLTVDTTGFDLATELSDMDAPAGDMEQFKKNLGLTNPAGYGGTDDGAGGLWQIGGGQNTIGNTGPTLYPSGTVVTDVGIGGWENLAVGTVVIPALDHDWVFTLDTGFANTIDAGQYPATVYDVSEAGTVSIVGALTFLGQPPLPTCLLADINCDGYVDNGDLGVMKAPANWGMNPPGNLRAELNGTPPVDNGDLGVLKAPANWGQSTGPCTCP